MSEEAAEYKVSMICERPDSKGMTLNEYQVAAMTTCMETCDNISYMLLNLVGEVGEFASKIAKHIRKREVTISGNELWYNRNSTVYETDLRKEAGDCLWQLAGLCKVMGWTLEDVARENLEKLADRKARGMIDGDGDGR